MKRRDFLKGLFGGIVAAPAVAKVVKEAVKEPVELTPREQAMVDIVKEAHSPTTKEWAPLDHDHYKDAVCYSACTPPDLQFIKRRGFG